MKYRKSEVHNEEEDKYLWNKIKVNDVITDFTDPETDFDIQVIVLEVSDKNMIIQNTKTKEKYMVEDGAIYYL